MNKKKTRIYLGAMILGGVALFVDRCLLSSSATGPLPASAGHTRPGAPPAAATEAPKASPDLAVPELPFPRNLPLWDAGSEIRDLFSPTPETTADKRPGGDGDGHAGLGTCAAFAKAHRLEAVLVQERLRIAVIDGHWVRVGESLDGCTFLEASGNKVRFRCRDGELSLALTSASEVNDR